jgi:hypothetical protein
MSIDFPANPTLNQEHTEAGQTWYWTSLAWAISGNAFDELTVLNLVYPIGSIYISNLASDPATQWPSTSWELDSIDKVMVGAGGARVGDDTFGSDTHQLVIDESPSHIHSGDPVNTGTTTAGNHNHYTYFGYMNDVDYYGNNIQAFGPNNTGFTSQNYAMWTNTTGNHSHNLNIANFSTTGTGGDQPHSSVQASKAFYMWKRVT